ncbi:MAG: hypothetical protein ACFFCD_16780 [Promethearchaeota archaeon]
MSGDEVYPEELKTQLKPIVSKRAKRFEERLKNIQSKSTAYLPTSIINDYIQGVQTYEELIKPSLESYLSVLTLLLQKEYVLEGVEIYIDALQDEGLAVNLLENEFRKASEALKTAKTTLDEVLKNMKTTQEFETVLFAYNFMKQALRYHNAACLHDGSDFIFLLNCLATKSFTEGFMDFAEVCISLRDKRKANLVGGMDPLDELAKSILRSATATFRTINLQHINNPDEQALYDQTRIFRLPKMEKAYEDEKYVLAITTAIDLFYDMEFIKYAGFNMHPAYMQKIVEDKRRQFVELIKETRKRGRFDGLLSIYYLEQCFLPSTTPNYPAHLIASFNTAKMLLGSMERDLKSMTDVLTYL